MGSLHGANSSGDNKTLPTIQIVGYQGAAAAVCVVSLVEADVPYRAHPHNLVGKDGLCKQGVCSVQITKPDMTYAFQNLGIQCVKKKEIAESLEVRKKIKVDLWVFFIWNLVFFSYYFGCFLIWLDLMITWGPFQFAQ